MFCSLKVNTLVIVKLNHSLTDFIGKNLVPMGSFNSLKAMVITYSNILIKKIFLKAMVILILSSLSVIDRNCSLIA